MAHDQPFAPVAITGMHRSGTSMITRALHDSGLHLIGSEASRSSSTRPRTTPKASGRTRRSSRATTSSSRRPAAPGTTRPTSRRTPSTTPGSLHVAEASTAAIAGLSEHDHWGFKDPRTCLTARLLARPRARSPLHHLRAPPARGRALAEAPQPELVLARARALGALLRDGARARAARAADRHALRHLLHRSRGRDRAALRVRRPHAGAAAGAHRSAPPHDRRRAGRRRCEPEPARAVRRSVPRRRRAPRARAARRRRTGAAPRSSTARSRSATPSSARPRSNGSRSASGAAPSTVREAACETNRTPQRLAELEPSTAPAIRDLEAGRDRTRGGRRRLACTDARRDRGAHGEAIAELDARPAAPRPGSSTRCDLVEGGPIKQGRAPSRASRPCAGPAGSSAARAGRAVRKSCRAGAPAAITGGAAAPARPRDSSCAGSATS